MKQPMKKTVAARGFKRRILRLQLEVSGAVWMKWESINQAKIYLVASACRPCFICPACAAWLPGYHVTEFAL